MITFPHIFPIFHNYFSPISPLCSPYFTFMSSNFSHFPLYYFYFPHIFLLSICNVFTDYVIFRVYIKHMLRWVLLIGFRLFHFYFYSILPISPHIPILPLFSRYYTYISHLFYVDFPLFFIYDCFQCNIYEHFQSVK